MGRDGKSQWFAERTLTDVGDDATPDVVTIWIERKPGAVWAVGRAVNLAERADGTIRADDYVFEGYEMEDALEAANDALESDRSVAGAAGRRVEDFTSQDLLVPLERWFFGHAPRPRERSPRA